MSVTLNTTPVSEVFGSAYDVQPLAKNTKEVEKPKDEYILMPANPQVLKGKGLDVLCMGGYCPVQGEVGCEKEVCNGKVVNEPCDKTKPEPCDKTAPEPCDKTAPEPCDKSRCDVLA